MQQQIVRADYRLFTEERYLHEMIVRENWVIGPEEAPYTPGVPRRRSLSIIGQEKPGCRSKAP
ncbi:MAG: hypothetical protein U1E35_03015 [Rhodospirillales bacterium]